MAQTQTAIGLEARLLCEMLLFLVSVNLRVASLRVASCELRVASLRVWEFASCEFASCEFASLRVSQFASHISKLFNMTLTFLLSKSIRVQTTLNHIRSVKRTFVVTCCRRYVTISVSSKVSLFLNSSQSKPRFILFVLKYNSQLATRKRATRKIADPRPVHQCKIISRPSSGIYLQYFSLKRSSVVSINIVMY